MKSSDVILLLLKGTYNKLHEKGKSFRALIQQHLVNWYSAKLEGCNAKSLEKLGQGGKSLLSLIRRAIFRSHQVCFE